ncbi:MAG: DUF1549 domain-containing protein, partial [Planctomycetia bacterium]|nr:DUF1549 domain-containing protein [Planctomycetia bacterium]
MIELKWKNLKSVRLIAASLAVAVSASFVMSADEEKKDAKSAKAEVKDESDPKADAKPTAKKRRDDFTTGSSDVLLSFINEQIRQGWTDNEVEPSELAGDGEWIRRVYLDIVGHVPPIEDVDKFLADKDKAKRSKLIDKLLDEPAYVRHWTTVWTNLTIG